MNEERVELKLTTTAIIETGLSLLKNGNQEVTFSYDKFCKGKKVGMYLTGENGAIDAPAVQIVFDVPQLKSVLKFLLEAEGEQVGTELVLDAQ